MFLHIDVYNLHSNDDRLSVGRSVGRSFFCKVVVRVMCCFVYDMC